MALEAGQLEGPAGRYTVVGAGWHYPFRVERGEQSRLALDLRGAEQAADWRER